MHPARHSLVAAAERGWLAGPFLFIALVSPPIEAWTEQSLVAHHFVHWLMVVAGALLGSQFRQLVRFPGRTAVAWAGLGVALAWHLPPLLSWAEADRITHMFAHATLVVGGGAVGWAVPQLSSPGKAYLFVAANAVMWPLVLAELAGGFSYAGYSGQASAAGFAELVAMAAAWLVFAVWGSLHSLLSRPPAPVTAQALFAVVAILGWVAPF